VFLRDTRKGADMRHANYYEPKAVAFRPLMASHYVKCDGCGGDTCNPQPLKEEFRPCRFCGDGSSIVNGRILCGMCY